jgi:hypothetical protein
MGLLAEIQEALLDEKRELGPVLLKLRFLAARLGSDVLEEWVKHELEGYPKDAEVPDYRRVAVSYTGTFSGPFGSGVKNAPIPSAIIDKHAGEHWSLRQMRESISALEALIRSSNSGTLHIRAANLILLLQGKVYEDLACNEISGTISTSALVGIQTAVRARILDLTLQLERRVPLAGEIELGPQKRTAEPPQAEAVTNITYNVIHGHQTTITNSGAGAAFEFEIHQGEANHFERALTEAGIPAKSAKELTEIVRSEHPEPGEAFGSKAKDWLAKNIGKAIDGTWKIGVAAASHVITEAALRYYGLK